MTSRQWLSRFIEDRQSPISLCDVAELGDGPFVPSPVSLLSRLTDERARPEWLTSIIEGDTLRLAVHLDINLENPFDVVTGATRRDAVRQELATNDGRLMLRESTARRMAV